MSFRIIANRGSSWSAVYTRAILPAFMVVVLVVSISTLHAAEPVIAQHTTITTERTFIDGDGYWDVDANWNPQGEPQDGDHVIIPDGGVCRVRTSNARADSFEVQEGGLLLIHNQLTIDNNSEVDDDEGVQLTRQFSEDRPKLVIDGDVILSGFGSIKGMYPDAKIIIPPYRCLINEARIEGTLRFVGTQTLSSSATNLAQGTLINGREIIANVAGDLVVESTIAITSHTNYAGEWSVEHASAGLILSAVWVSSLSDSFSLISGELEVNTSIVTSGDLTQEGGLLDINADLTLHDPDYPKSTSLYTFNGGSLTVASGVTFSYDDFAGTQDNPDNTKDEDPPYEVVGPFGGG